MGHESAAVAFLQTACGEEAAGLADKFQEFTTCDRDVRPSPISRRTGLSVLCKPAKMFSRKLIE